MALSKRGFAKKTFSKGKLLKGGRFLEVDSPRKSSLTESSQTKALSKGEFKKQLSKGKLSKGGRSLRVSSLRKSSLRESS